MANAAPRKPSTGRGERRRRVSFEGPAWLDIAQVERPKPRDPLAGSTPADVTYRGAYPGHRSPKGGGCASPSILVVIRVGYARR